MQTEVIYQGVLVVSLLVVGCVLSDNHFCSFDDGTCGYANQLLRGRGLWDRRQNIRGIKDHTSGNGSFMYAKYQYSWRSRSYKIAQLFSPSFKNIRCVQFYYYRKTSASRSLDVLANINSKTSLLWSVEIGNSPGWKFASIPITVSGNNSIKLIFQSEAFIGHQGLTAIDDINVTDTSSCSLYPAQPKNRIFKEVHGSCHFDTSWCGYTNTNGSKVWRRNRYKTLTYGTGPDYDHTFKTGAYAFAESSGIKTGTKSQLISPILTNVQCATFYYHMFGAHTGALNIYERVQNTDHRVFNIIGNQGKLWQKCIVYLDHHAADSSFKLVFESVRGSGYKGDIAIDDILTFSSCRRPTKTPTLATTPAERTTHAHTPHHDPTTETPWPTLPPLNNNTPAWPTLPPLTTNMPWTTPGSIPHPTTGQMHSIRLVNGPSKYEGRVEVLHNGQWGTICDDSWDDEEAAVTCRMLGFPGFVRGVRASGYGRGSGTIWLDDVSCTGKEKSIFDCRHAEWGKNNCGHSEDSGVVCQADFVKTPNNGSCTFDFNTCGYTNADRSVSEFDWKRYRGSTPSSNTGPTSDVSGSGYYMYIEVSSGSTGARAQLISPVFSSYINCMTFYYHMRGSEIGTLNVYIQPSAPNSTIVKVWTLSRQQGTKWLRGQVALNDSGDQEFQVIFEGVRGNDYKGDIAIDSITTLNATCDVLPAKAIYKPDPNAQEGNVRLVGGVDPKQGRLEIYHQGQWGTICKNKWSNKNTKVVCKMLGFGTGRTATASFGLANGPIWLDNVECNGKERSLSQCRKSSWGHQSCSHSQDVAISCLNGTSDWECKNHRILNQADRSASYARQGTARCDKNGGLVGIYPGEWHRFDGAAGQMMPEICIPVKRCNTHATGWLSGAHPSVEEGIVQRKVCFHWSDNCCKWSTNIQVKNCSKFYIYEFVNPPVCQLRYCGSETAAGPTPPPTPPPPKIPIRLVGGSNNYSGRVEVYHNGKWGTVCDDDWDIRDGHVACRMLGYPRAFKVHFGGQFPGGTGKIWLDNLQCKGNENNLWSCRRNGWDNCGHSEDAGVTCFTEELYTCNFEKGLCGYTLSNSWWYGWKREKASKYLTDHSIAKDGYVKCSNGWASYNKYCYYFKHHAGRITWNQAKQRCLGMNAWLVDIRDKAEWKFIKKQRMSGVEQYHVGVSEFNGSNVWTYYDGSVMNLTNMWAPGEPNDWNGNKEDCAAMDFRKKADGRFNDIPCASAYGFAGIPNSYVCKKQPSRALGHYLVVDLSRFPNTANTATLTSVQVVNATCLRFYYNTNGTYIDNMRVSLDPTNDDNEILVWQLEGNFGNQWKRAQIPLIDMGSTEFKIKIHVIHSSSKGEILIDDVNITSNPDDACTFMPIEATPPTWKDVGSCNFEIADTCNYSNVEDNAYKDELNWFRVTGHHLSPTKRPRKDHTLNLASGSYVVMKTPRGILRGHIGRLVSPVISAKVKCVTFFWFFAVNEMYDMGLTVYVRPAHSTSMSDEIALWKISTGDAQGLLNQWSKGIVPLSQKEDYQIIFEGMYNGNQQSVSLDDIMVLNKACSIYPNFSTPPSVAPTTTGLRLAGSSRKYAGRVEIFHKGRWGTVCGDNWNMNNAHVVCRQLGFIGALAAPCCGLFGKGSGRVWLSNIRCSTNPQVKSISQCPHNGWGNNQCTHHRDAGVLCHTKNDNDKDIKLRLSGGKTKLEGRVDVNYVGVWGTINDIGWDILDATVVCRQLNYTGAVGAYLNSNFGRGNGPVWFSSVGCKGNESSIARCIDHGKMQSQLSHKKDAGVECFDARLAGGKSPNEGRVEINYKGKWGTVCNKDWNINSANVICRDLGYLRAKAKVKSFGKGKGEIRLSGVKCTGDEVSIALCSHHGWNVHDCDHSQDVGVVCTNEQAPKRRTPCSSGPCKNKGKCKVVKQSFSCQCSRYFTGQTCKTFIGSSVVSVLLKGDIKKWDPQTFKKSIAKMLNKYCQDCIDKSVRTKRESEKSSQFSSDDVIIVEDPSKSSRSPPGYLYIEFVVVKKSNGKSIVVKPSKIHQTLNKGAADGIGGYSVIGVKERVAPSNSSPSKPQVQAQARAKPSDNIAMKIGFAVVLTVLIVVLAALAVVYIIRKRTSRGTGNNTYILRSVGKNSKSTNRDNEVLINEEDNHML